MISEQKDLLAAAKDGDREACQEIIHTNDRLIWSIVQRYTGRGVELEDLFQLGCIGFLKAIQGFDPDYGTCFSTYAVPKIAGEIRRFLRDDGAVKVSRSIKENSWRVKRMAAELSQKLEREPSMDELSAAVELPVEDIVLALEATAEVESLHKPICFQDGKEVSLEEKIPERKDWQEELMNRLIVEELLEQLQTKERELIQMRYYDGKTQREIAEHLGISQVQVSRLEKKLLLQMREKIAGKKFQKNIDNPKIIW